MEQQEVTKNIHKQASSDHQDVPTSKPKKRWAPLVLSIVFFVSFLAFVLFTLRVFPLKLASYDALASRPSFLGGVKMEINPRNLSMTGIDMSASSDADDSSQLLLYDFSTAGGESAKQTLILVDSEDYLLLSGGETLTLRGLIRDFPEDIRSPIERMLEVYENTSSETAKEMASSLVLIDMRHSVIRSANYPIYITMAISVISLIGLFLTGQRKKQPEKISDPYAWAEQDPELIAEAISSMPEDAEVEEAIQEEIEEDTQPKD